MALYKRPGSKYYWFKFTFDGDLVQRSSQCTNKKDAATVEAAFRTQLALGKIGIKPKPKAPLFKIAAEDFLKWSEIQHAQKPKSFVRISYSCQTLIDFFGEMKVDRIEPKDVEKFISNRSKQISKKTGEPITRDTINLELTALKTIFRRLISAGILSESPARDIKQLAENERKFHVLTNDEEKIYLLACPQPLRDVAGLIIETGMRPIEVYNLTRFNVNLSQGFVQIVNGKTKSSNRKIWLNEKAASILQDRLKKFKGEFVFPKGDKDGEPATYQLNEQHRTVLATTKLKFRLYDCRHTFATRVLESGTDLLTLASMLGHSNLDEVTRYAHPSENRKIEAIKNIQNKAQEKASKKKKRKQ